MVPGTVTTPCGEAAGLVAAPDPRLYMVSIIRSGDILQESVRSTAALTMSRIIQPGVTMGKILIQRDETLPEKPAVLFYKKLPENITDYLMMLVDPMVASAGGASKAITVLQDLGVQPDTILFLSLLCAPEGLKALARECPGVKVHTKGL